MEKIIHKLIDVSTEGSEFYSYKDSIWLVLSEKNEWIFDYYEKTEYLWFNYSFFNNLFRYLDLELEDNSIYVRSWIENTFNLKLGQHCHPDYLPGNYDWSSMFDVIEVMNKGVKI